MAPAASAHRPRSTSRRRAWVSSFEDSAVVLVDLDSGTTLASAVVDHPTGIAVAPGGDRVWVVEHRGDRVRRLEPDTLEVAATVERLMKALAPA